MTDVSKFLASVNADQSSSVRSQFAQFQEKFQQLFQQVVAGLQQPCSLDSTDISTAVIIEDVGVETLSQELGFDLDFNFDSIYYNL